MGSTKSSPPLPAAADGRATPFAISSDNTDHNPKLDDSPKSSILVSQGHVDEAKTNLIPKFDRNHTHQQQQRSTSGNGSRFVQGGFNRPPLHPPVPPQFRPNSNSSYRRGNFGPSGFYPPPPAGFMRPTFRDMVNPNLYAPPFPMPHGTVKPIGFPTQDSLPTLIVKQIDYYFSDANLVKDLFLRSNMDDQGFVPISLIANFPRVKNLTENIPFILNSLTSSTVVEVQGYKIRRKNGWERWILDSSLQTSKKLTTKNMVAYAV